MKIQNGSRRKVQLTIIALSSGLTMNAAIAEEVTQFVLRADLDPNLKREKVVQDEVAVSGKEDKAVKKKPVRKNPNDQIGRNDPCWCGSGKKYKNCHGRQA